LGRCARTGSTLHVVAFKPRCGTCMDEVEDFCEDRKLGKRDFHCWGYAD
jgi:hypothetical protein